ncbi:MAG: Gfo/Idh/MocA family oxidoreductase [Clostridia bacterium]|nr:Gfo/Idh/MocA family oxidoreductase [Clostridia bacterium]
MKAAVIGYGVIGKHHVKILSEMGVLSAVCDIDKNAVSGLEGVELYENYIEMLDKVSPDVVHICTPHYLHAEMVIEALGRNINVLCEKPLCIKEEDIPRILEAEKNSKAILGVCHQNRYNPANLYVKDYIEDKTVEGGVGQVSWNRDAKYYASGAWRGRWDTEGGGVLINQALHTLDLMQWFCGMPDTLSASTSNLTLDGKIEVEDTAAICAKGDVGFNFYASNGSALDMPVEITLKVSGKTVKLMPRYVVVDGEIKSFPKEKPNGTKTCYGSGHGRLFEHFYRCVREGEHFPIDGAEAAKVIKIILAVYKSHGKSVKI